MTINNVITIAHIAKFFIDIFITSTFGYLGFSLIYHIGHLNEIIRAAKVYFS